MKPVPYFLVCAVQDLHDLYQRINPTGPYRMELFHDSPPVEKPVPSGLRHIAPELDTMIRGVSCLLASNLTIPAIPVIRSIWKLVRGIHGSVTMPGGAVPAYYEYMTHELDQIQDTLGTAARDENTDARVYQLFGEVLAVYLDLLDAMRNPGQDSIRSRIDALRTVIAQSGSSSNSD